MNTSLWIITDGKHEERLNRLIESCKPFNVNVLCYGKTDNEEYFKPSDFNCPLAGDTLFTANFNRILWRELNSPPKIYKARNHCDYTSINLTVPDSVLIMNDDIEWHKGSLKRLLEYSEHTSMKWGTINPCQVSFSNPERVIMGGTGSCFPSGRHMAYNKNAKVLVNETTWGWIPFCAPLINLDAVRAVGMLDPSMRMWCSDTDWCMRSKWGQFDIVLLHDCFINHEEHGTIDSEKRTELFLNDSTSFKFKWAGEFFSFYTEEGQDV